MLPVIEALQGSNVPLSVDTCKPEVMRAAIDAGADMINDINALQGEGALEAVAGSNVAVCLMHMQGEPQTMQLAPRYEDVVAEVMAFLAARWPPQRPPASPRAPGDRSRLWLRQVAGT